MNEVSLGTNCVCGLLSECNKRASVVAPHKQGEWYSCNDAFPRLRKKTASCTSHPLPPHHRAMGVHANK